MRRCRPSVRARVMPQFDQIQLAFARHLRNPAVEPAPADLEDRRVEIYRELLFNNLQGLLANKVPMFSVHGDSDTVVPYDLNTKLLKERYEAGGGSIQVKVIPGEGHKVGPSFFECQELVDFVLKLP